MSFLSSCTVTSRVAEAICPFPTTSQTMTVTLGNISSVKARSKVINLELTELTVILLFEIRASELNTLTWRS